MGDVQVAVSTSGRPYELFFPLPAHGLGASADTAVAAASGGLTCDQSGARYVPALEGSATGVEVVHGDQIRWPLSIFPGVCVVDPTVAAVTTTELAQVIDGTWIGAVGAVGVEGGEYGDVARCVEVERVGAG